MEFEEFSKQAIKQINKQLSQLLADWREEVGKIDKNLLPLVDKFIAGCFGGKKIRGVLVVLGNQIGKQAISRACDLKILGCRQKVTDKEIYKVAAGYEIFHSAILAHDDVIDQSLLRRGKSSLHMALGGGHYGLSQAICLGDCGFFLAVKVISESGFQDKEKIEALKWFSQIMVDTGAGEMLDVEKGDVTTIMTLKTARYSISGPLALGAILGGGRQNLVRDFGAFGENLGIAFQIQDDILGVFGSEGQVGKSVTSDIEEGKNTLLYNYALSKASSLQRKMLDRYYGQGIQGVRGCQSVRQIFKDTGALDYAKKEAEKYKNLAMKVLPGLTEDLRMSKILEQMGEYLVNRIK